MQKRHLISRHQKLQIFSLWISRACKTSFFAWNHNQFALFDSSVTQSKVMYNQSSSQSPASVAAAKEDSIILHAIALYFPLAHYEFSSSIVSFCNLYLISSPPGLWNMHFLWNIHYKSRKGRYFWLFSLFLTRVIDRLPRGFRFWNIPRGTPVENHQKFSRAFSPSAFNVSLQIIPV